MQLSVNKLTSDPVVLTGTGLLGAALLVMLSSIAILIAAFLYSPDINIISTTGEKVVSGINTAQIGTRNFFGFADAESEVAVDDLPETKLELTLRGAFASENTVEAGAIIENNENRIADHYSIGEELPGDATLKAIFADRVVLVRNGLLETLYFPDVNENQGIGARRNASPSPNASSGVDRQAKERREAIKDRIKQLRNRS